MSHLWYFLTSHWPAVLCAIAMGFILGVLLGCTPQERDVGPSLSTEEFACVWDTEQVEECLR